MQSVPLSEMCAATRPAWESHAKQPGWVGWRESGLGEPEGRLECVMIAQAAVRFCRILRRIRTARIGVGDVVVDQFIALELEEREPGDCF